MSAITTAAYDPSRRNDLGEFEGEFWILVNETNPAPPDDDWSPPSPEPDDAVDERDD